MVDNNKVYLCDLVDGVIGKGKRNGERAGGVLQLFRKCSTGEIILDTTSSDIQAEAFSREWDDQAECHRLSDFMTAKVAGALLGVMAACTTAVISGESGSSLWPWVSLPVVGYSSGGWTYAAYMKSRDNKLKDQKPSAPEPQ